MAIAVIAVLAAGVGLGYLIVSRNLGASAEPNVADAAVDEAASRLVRCTFTTDIEDAHLIIDGQDFDIIPEGGVRIDLPPGPHSVHAQRAGVVVVRRRIVLRAGDRDVSVELTGGVIDGGAPNLPTSLDAAVEAPEVIGDADVEEQALELETAVPVEPTDPSPRRTAEPVEPRAERPPRVSAPARDAAVSRPDPEPIEEAPARVDASAPPEPPPPPVDAAQP